MSNPKYLQARFDKQLSHLIEECGELLAAAGKLQRWGAWSVNPDLPKNQQKANIQWLLEEMEDVVDAMKRLSETVENEPDLRALQ